ncbi:MAG: hypothetical protein DRK00_06400 [Thermoprotei archaeon]|nr:MAG: hypothetical protein DRK00_06400 [Thermoprotei archaeon]
MEASEGLEELSRLADDPALLERFEYYVDRLRELLSSPRHRFDPASPVPELPGVYVVRRGDEVIYVGSTGNLRRRLLGDHLRGNVEGSWLRRALSWDLGIAPVGARARLSRVEEDRISEHLRMSCTFQYIVEEDERKRVMIEHFAIALLSPRLASPIRL